MDISNLLNLPIEILATIIEEIYNPKFILDLYQTNQYMRIVTKEYIKMLKTDNISYLGTDWLNNFYNLEVIDDNIIFEYNMDKFNSNDYNTKDTIINIPVKLSKFNILLSSNRSIYDKFLIEDIKKIIADILLQVIDDLNIITIRIHIQPEELYNSFTLLIDKNTINIINTDLGKNIFHHIDAPYNIISSIPTKTGIMVGMDIPILDNNKYLIVKPSHKIRDTLYIENPSELLEKCNYDINDKSIDVLLNTGFIYKTDFNYILENSNCDNQLIEKIIKMNENYLYVPSHLTLYYIDNYE